MRKRATILVLLGVIVAVPNASAGANRRTRHTLTETIDIALVSSHGNRITDAGIVTGTRGTGALIEHDTTHGAAYRGTDTAYYANGTLRGSLTGHVAQGPGGVRIFWDSCWFGGDSGVRVLI